MLLMLRKPRCTPTMSATSSSAPGEIASDIGMAYRSAIEVLAWLIHFIGRWPLIKKAV